MNQKPPQGQDLWRSLDEVADTEEFRRFVEREFPTHSPEVLASRSRRHFLKVMGASVALAGMSGLTGCIRWPREKILPFANRPEGRLPGVPVHYATALERDGVGQGLLATSFDGRPIKVDGNPEHPTSLGSLDMQGQASVLGLYDPARSRGVSSSGAASDWAAARTAMRSAAAAGGMAVLSTPTSSPTVRRMRERLGAEVSNVQWFEYCPLSRDAEREGTRQVFGKPHRPVHDIASARLVLCLDADPLMTHPASLSHSRGFASARTARREGARMLKLLSVEAGHSVTGSVADRRWGVRPEQVAGIAARIAAAVNSAGLPSDIATAIAGAGEPSADEQWIADELNRNRGACIVMAGDRQPAEVHALAHLLNLALENNGRTVRYTAEQDPERTPHVEQISELVSAMRGGQVKSLLVLGGNPVFDAPADLDFADALAQVGTRIRVGLYEDETSMACQWHLPEAHYLETWLDSRAWDGTVTITQPLIEPLYGGRNAAEILGLILDETPEPGYDLLRDTLRGMAGSSDFEEFWRECVHRGFVAGSAARPESPRVGGGWGTALSERTGATGGEFSAVFTGDHSVYDGRYANNGWLQECPDPMTKIAWDNAAIIAPSDAERLGVKNGHLLNVTVGAESIEIAAFVLPGQPVGTVALPVGYGREVFDRVAGGVSYNLAKGTGVDVYPLRTAAAVASGSVAATVSKGRGKYELATTQDHWAIGTLQEEETELRASEFARVVDHDTFREKGHAAVEALGPHVPHHESLFDEFVYKGQKWGMSIDLNVCTGCTACVIACQAENNIGVTGKEEVAYGREMHWIRIDRYFKGEDYDDPQVIHQPMTCHHCENAPCEQVCPVAATVHSDEGLNDMVYNRCIGTRYCSNNCPYKVRRFNYFNNAKVPADSPERMAYNPEVSIRNRGVMEKCTYCVQRISAARITAKNEGRSVQDGDVTPACAQTCPTQAITFGDLADPESRVSKAQHDERAYGMLEQLHVKPRTKYLAKVVHQPREGS